MLQLVFSMNQQPNLPHVKTSLTWSTSRNQRSQKFRRWEVNKEWPTFYGSFLSRSCSVVRWAILSCLLSFWESSMGVGETATFYLQTNRVFHIYNFFWVVTTGPTNLLRRSVPSILLAPPPLAGAGAQNIWCTIPCHRRILWQTTGSRERYWQTWRLVDREQRVQALP